MRIKSVAVAAACAWLAAPLHPVAAGEGHAPGSGDTSATTRLIIKLRAGTPPGTSGQEQAHAGGRVTVQGFGPSQRERARGLAARSGLGVRVARDLGRGMVAIGLDKPLAGEQLEQTLVSLRAEPDIEFAEVDRRRYIRALPSDPLFASQWYLRGAEPSATDFEAAWDTTTGSADTVIAILDTGIRFDHPDLAARAVTGYDFVSGESPTDFVSANDGDDWDDDASDSGYEWE